MVHSQLVSHDIESLRVLIVDRRFQPMPTPDGGIKSGSQILEALKSKKLRSLVPSNVYHVGPCQTVRLPLVAQARFDCSGTALSGVAGVNSKRVRIRDLDVDMYTGNLIEAPQQATWDHIIPQVLAPHLRRDWANSATTLSSTNNNKDCRTNEECGLSLVWSQNTMMWEPLREDLWRLEVYRMRHTMPDSWRDILKRFERGSVRDACLRTMEVYDNALKRLEKPEPKTPVFMLANPWVGRGIGGIGQQIAQQR